MNPTHIGVSPRGRRVHLTNARGWSSCSRRFADVSPIEQTDTRLDDPWCEVCLGRLAEDAARSIGIFCAQNAAVRWNAKAEIDVGQLIAGYLSENPPPCETALAADLAEWARNLARDGEERLASGGGV